MGLHTDGSNGHDAAKDAVMNALVRAQILYVLKLVFTGIAIEVIRVWTFRQLWNRFAVSKLNAQPLSFREALSIMQAARYLFGWDSPLSQKQDQPVPFRGEPHRVESAAMAEMFNSFFEQLRPDAAENNTVDRE